MLKHVYCFVLFSTGLRYSLSLCHVFFHIQMAILDQPPFCLIGTWFLFDKPRRIELLVLRSGFYYFRRQMLRKRGVYSISLGIKEHLWRKGWLPGYGKARDCWYLAFCLKFLWASLLDANVVKTFAVTVVSNYYIWGSH